MLAAGPLAALSAAQAAQKFAKPVFTPQSMLSAAQAAQKMLEDVHIAVE